MITRYCGRYVTFTRVKEIVALIFAATIVNFCTSLIGAGTAAISDLEPFWSFWRIWWISDGLGILLITPLIVVWSSSPRLRWVQILEAVFFMVVWCGAALLAFHAENLTPFHFIQPYVFVVLIAWASLRSGQRTVTLALIMLGISAIISKPAIAGPLLWAGDNLTDRLLLVQTYLGCTTVVGLLLTASHADAKSKEHSLKEEHSRLRALGDNLPDGMVYQVVREHNGSMRFLYVSAGVERLDGVFAEDVLRDPLILYNLLVEEDRLKVATAENDSARTMKAFNIEARFRQRGGQFRWMQLSSMPRHLVDGRIVWDGIATDITERKHANEVMTELAIRNQILLQNAADGIHVLDEQGNVVEVNTSFCSMLGYTREEIMQLNVADWDIQWSREALLEKIRELFSANATFETRHRRKDGQIRNVEINGTGVVLQGRLCLYASARDITKRKQAETALRESEEKYRALFHNELYAIYIFDLETLRFLDVNDAFVRLYDYTKYALINRRTVLDITGESQETKKSIELITSDGTIYIPLRFHKKKDGTVFPVEIVGGLHTLLGKKVIFALARDISERRQTEEALKEAHRCLDAIVEFSPDATFVINANGKVTHWNRAIEEMTGVLKADMLGRGDCEYAVPFYGNRRQILIDYATAISSGTTLDVTGYDFMQREGDWFLGESYTPQVFRGRGAYLSATATVLRDSMGNVVGAIESIRDITDHKQAEEDRVRLERQLLHVQKLESLGRMAGAISHHFNNMLGIVIGNLELARDDIDHNSEFGTYISEAMEASYRVVEMSRLMLTYLGQTIAKKERLDFTKLVGDAQSLFSASNPENVHMKIEACSQRVMVYADGVHIQQILTNLVSNAVEAIGEEEGRITLAVEVVAVEKIQTLRCFPTDWNPKKNSYACLSVADTGSGLDATTLEMIFDPFYTTKFTGRGLGLPVVLGLVRGYEGAVTVESSPGEGAVFRVYFPIDGPEKSPSEKEVHITPQIKEGGLVMVDDDDPMARNMARTTLEGDLAIR